jgi:AcrR family transcriptional regulator
VSAASEERKWHTPRGDATRAGILRAALTIAQAEGLEALTVGRLASALEMSKSGLFAHFGSKEELQLATVDAARIAFVEEVVKPAVDAAPGLPRLRALCEAWLAYAEREVSRGGCFFSRAAAEFDARPGAVRDRVAESLRQWMSGLEQVVGEARALGHLDPRTEPPQLAFELHAMETAANSARLLFDDKKAFRRARAAIDSRLEQATTKRSRR